MPRNRRSQPHDAETSPEEIYEMIPEKENLLYVVRMRHVLTLIALEAIWTNFSLRTRTFEVKRTFLSFPSVVKKK
jgi:hypothetical protein